jgi:hypothetical protein
MEKIIFQLSEEPYPTMLKPWELTHHFYAGNPYWTQEDEPLDLQNFTRSEAIDILRKGLGIGYSITGDIITVSNPQQHLQTIMRHLQSVATSCLTSIYPLGWWKNDVCGYGGILISFGNELMTLNEFLLYAITKFSEGITTFYIGSIFEYY